jgi:putative hydrolase of the HAD superfamily
MIRTIVFDFGNVVGFFDHRRATRRLAELTGVAEERLHPLLFDNTLEDDYESGRLSSAAFLEEVRRRCGVGCADDVLGRAYCDIFWPNSDVCGLVPLLKPGYRLLLGSNTTELHSRHFRREFANVLRHFDALVLSHEVGVRKPAAAFFAHCQRLAGSRPDECVFIDDLEPNVAGARACGWHGIVYAGGAGLRRGLAELGVNAGAGQGGSL